MVQANQKAYYALSDEGGRKNTLCAMAVGKWCWFCYWWRKRFCSAKI